MKLKVDKELLLKHKFWILLTVFLLLWLSSIGILYYSAATPLDLKRKNYESAKNSVANAEKKKPKNEKFLEPWRQYGAAFANQKETVWQQAWEMQKEMIKWPYSASAPFQERWLKSATLAEFLKSVAEESTQPKGWQSGQVRTEYKDLLYKMQFQGLQKEIKPVEMLGGVEGVFQPVAWSQPPLIEELWLAQEDFWIRKELFGIVRSVLDSVAQFEPVQVPKEETLPNGIRARHRFRNSNWELDLLVEEQPREKGRFQISGKSKIKNIHLGKRTQKLAHPRTNKPLVFRLHQGPNAVTLQVTGEQLLWGQSTTFDKATEIHTINLLKPFALEQIFSWYTAPIKRLDALQVPYQSHRTATRDLLANTQLGVGDPAEGAAPVAAGPATAKPGGVGPAPAGKAAPGTAGKRGEDGGTPNGLKRKRYLHLTEQCRHMPVGILVVVDQAHIHDMLIAVANCKLRMQIVQVTFDHVHGITPPPEEERTETPVAAEGVERGATRPAAGAAQPHAVSTAVPYEEDPNLVELAIYGIATLYERFPDKTPAAGSSGTVPGASTSPAVPPRPAGTAVGPGGQPTTATTKSPPAASAGTPAKPSEAIKGLPTGNGPNEAGKGPTQKGESPKSGTGVKAAVPGKK